MNSQSEREQLYQREAQTLGKLGEILLQANLPTIQVALPKVLAEQAVMAWERDDYAELEYPEGPAQRVDRTRAAALALIGTAISERGEAKGDEILVDLSPVEIGMAIDTADDLPSTSEEK